MPSKQFTTLGKDVESIGKMIGGWRKGLLTKTSGIPEEKNWVAGDHPVVSVPRIRIRNPIGVNVPLAVRSVPVEVDRPDYVPPILCSHCPLITLGAVFYLRPKSLLIGGTDSNSFF